MNNSLTIRYVFPDGMFGRIPWFTHKAVNKYLTDDERKVFMYSVSQSNGYKLSIDSIAENTYLRNSDVERCIESLDRKGYVSCDGSIMSINWNYIKNLSTGMVNLRDKEQDDEYQIQVDFMDGLD